MPEEVVFARKATGLTREVGLVSVAAVTWLFVTTGFFLYPFLTLYQEPGANIPLSYAIGTLGMIWPMFAIMFLTVAMPRSASDYVAISRSLHPLLGYLCNWFNWQSNVIWIGGAMLYTTIYFGNAFAIYGSATGNAALVQAASAMTITTPVTYLVAALAVVIAGALCIVALKWYTRIMVVLFVVPAVAIFIGVGVLAYYNFAGPSAMSAIWDKVFGAGAWKEIVDTATNGGWATYITDKSGSASAWGWPGGWTWSATLAAIVPATTALWGLEIANMVAGEIKNPTKVYPLGVILSATIIAIFYISGTFLMFSDYGSFASQYNFVMQGGLTSGLKLNPVTFPQIGILAQIPASATSPELGLVIGLAPAFIWLALPLTLTLLTSRMVFAMSFDRFWPTKFAEVNMRFHTPHWSVVFSSAVAIVYLLFFYYSPWFAALSIFALVALRYVIACWATTLMPFTRKDVFDTMPYAWKIGPVPVMTIVGLIGSAFCTWLFVTNIGLLASDNLSMIYEALYLTMALGFFALFYGYNQHRGIDVAALWREIPPA
jgi:APA family basic amino acid/polyamine antiporter